MITNRQHHRGFFRDWLWVVGALMFAVLALPSPAAVYQFSVMAGNRRAYLWIPPNCTHVRGVIMALANLLERNWLEDPLVREAAAAEGLGIVFLDGASGQGGAGLSADLRPGEGEALKQMFKDLAAESGYPELEFAPLIPMGHSANGQFSWNVARWDPERTIAAIPVKTVPLPAGLNLGGVPLCYVVGETTEWPQYRVPDPRTQPGDRDFYWPVVLDSAIALRAAGENNLVGVVTDPGGGHFDWGENQARFVALFIRKACQYRLPKGAPAAGPVKLNRLEPESGWLTDTGGMACDQFAPAPYKEYKGDPKKAYWFFDEETARAAAAFEGDRFIREKQMPTFIQNGQSLPVAREGFAPLRFMPEADGVTFKVQGAFLSEMPMELTGGGQPLGHAVGPITFRVVTGAAIQIAPDTFRVQFDRQGARGNTIWLQEEHPGDGQYRRAVQPGRLVIPARNTRGAAQSITFPAIPDQQAGTATVKLAATSDAKVPVYYYVREGPAEIEGDTLKLTPIPPRSKYPVKVTVVAWQYGRSVEPLLQSAQPVERTFLITKQPVKLRP